MAHLIDLPAVPRDEAEARERLAAYAESWRASAFSTEPADRDAAEAAIVGLYRNMNLKDPAILWVASPLAGALAYQAIGDYTTRLLNPFARGEIGTGAGRDFNALLDPFAFSEYVEQNCAGTAARRSVRSRQVAVDHRTGGRANERRAPG